MQAVEHMADDTLRAPDAREARGQESSKGSRADARAPE